MFIISFLLALCHIIHSVSIIRGRVSKPGITQKPSTTIVESKPGVTPVGGLNDMKPLDYAKFFVKTKLGFDASDYIVKNSYTSDHNKVTHVYLRQIYNGKEVINADININVNELKEILSYGNTFIEKKSIKDSGLNGKSLPIIEALETLMKELNITEKKQIKEVKNKNNKNEILLKDVPGALQDVRATQAWYKTEEGKLEPVWDFKIELIKDYYHAQVSINSKKVVNKVNWAANFAYKVVPFGINDPSEGKRELIIDPYDKTASPKGWHQFGIFKKSKNTAGNNVYAVKVAEGDKKQLDPSVRAKADKNNNFDFPMDETKDPSTYKDAAVTNLFYYSNMIHDLFYLYGFEEKAGNFQENNFGKGGKEKDAVIAHAQASTEKNNAIFKAPPDGEHGHLSIGIFDNIKPNRDADFDSGIVIHELTHGLSIRLTGGPANSDCFNKAESRGLGEGWSDFIAIMIRMNSKTKESQDFGMGKYLSGQPTSRNYLYSTSKITNPSDFKLLGDTPKIFEHDVGEIWAEFLFEVYWSLSKELPIADNWFEAASDTSKYANTLLLQLIIDGMKMQPCNPTFLQARDAILLAERVYTKEKHRCALWKGFAKRGMGVGAVVNQNDPKNRNKNSFEIPKGCPK